jgi:osmotically-inducible protein OsmY
MGPYSSEPVQSQHRWSSGFYTGEDRDERAREYAERPHGWGDYEANYGVSRGELRRVDAPAEGQYSDPHAVQRVGQHKGKGPKNYRRSDERTREIVCERLTEDARIDASDVEVRVQGGEITLSGSVPDRSMKHAAEDIAARCAPDEQIRNELKVRR